MNLDPRRHAFRPDLADARLRPQVSAARYTEGRLARVAVAVAGIHAAPADDAWLTSQVLFGERFRVFEEKDSWAWGQCLSDGYVGYLHATALDTELIEPTHKVCVLASYLYAKPGIKTQPAQAVYLNAQLTVVQSDDDFTKLADGRYIWRQHISPIGEHAADPAEVAAQFAYVPYLWGGKTQAGVDCSGLVQMSFAAAGRACPRDSDMMQAELGTALLINDLAGLQRGDLVFWKGHVGMMLDADRMVHANGYHMTTVIEPFAEAVQRIAALHGPVTAVRRP